MFVPTQNREEGRCSVSQMRAVLSTDAETTPVPFGLTTAERTSSFMSTQDLDRESPEIEARQ
jgi:hypothetical protein